jgi:putative tricarboxylic transport membrane protein
MPEENGGTTMIRLSRLAAACAFAALSSAAFAAPAELSIMAPAAPGGGWDQTARSMQSVLQEAGIVGNVQVVNVPGAGGTIGLAQFVNDDKGNATKLIVGGYVMVGAIIANKSPVSLADVTPLARLTGEYDAIVVPKDSPIKSLADLIAMLKADPGSVSWAGGSAGGVDHIAVGLIARAAGVDPTRINYVPFSGGGEALAAILGGQVTAGISGYGEFEGQVKAGELRLLALTGGPGGPDLPTLKSQGIDVDVQNWRMVAAAPGITDAEKADLVAAIEKMAGSDQWKAVLAAKGWQDTFLAGDAFATYLDEQVKATTEVLKDVGIAQ